jgi:hypothetical protein
MSEKWRQKNGMKIELVPKKGNKKAGLASGLSVRTKLLFFASLVRRRRNTPFSHTHETLRFAPSTTKV